MKKALKSLKVELAQFDFARSVKVSGISSCPISELRYGCLFQENLNKMRTLFLIFDFLLADSTWFFISGSR